MIFIKNLLVTGGAGFIGSNFIKYMLERYKYHIVNLDLLTYAGRLENLYEIEDHPCYSFIQGDIRDRQLVEDIFIQYDIDTVINFAAESHVDRSIENPEIFMSTNVIGVNVLLDEAKKYWMLEPGNKYCMSFKQGTKYLQISTDEVYGALEGDGVFTESSILLPNSPYAASKASADLLVRSYYQTYQMPVNITRCSNNYGPHQFPEKLIPLMIIKAYKDEQLPIYGDGMQIRDWLYVKDHCRAIDTVLHKGKNGEIYNIGGHTEKTNIEVVRLILSELGKSERLIKHVQDRLGHDRRYAIDYSKITRELGWKPQYAFEESISEVIRWYVHHINKL